MQRPTAGMVCRVVVFLAAIARASTRPTVRNVKSLAEWNKLLKHHAENTGLPVIVDFYSDGCGPCRMIAPQYKQLAEQYKDRAVFAKVDVNYNHQVSAQQQIRSMPTFQLYLFGKKREQFSGADINRLQHGVQSLVREAKMKNVEITLEALKDFYKLAAPEKLGDEAPSAPRQKRERRRPGSLCHGQCSQEEVRRQGPSYAAEDDRRSVRPAEPAAEGSEQANR